MANDHILTDSDSSALMQTRIDVAEMKGMLTTVIASHSEQIASHSAILQNHDLRLNDKAKTVARHDERIQDLEEDSSARRGQAMGATSLIIAGVLGFIALVDWLGRLGGI